MCPGRRAPESAPPIPAPRKRSLPWCGERQAWSPAPGSPECGRPDANHLHAQVPATDLEAERKVERDSAAGDGVATLSLTLGQFYQILACRKSQFVFRSDSLLRPPQHQPVHAPAHISEVGLV